MFPWKTKPNKNNYCFNWKNPGKNEKVAELNDRIVNSCLVVYQSISASLLPTPAKSHYTFNLRDLSKIFQGILMAEIKSIEVIWINLIY